jgi:hypothetical protein
MNEAAIHKAVIQRWRATGKPGTLLATIPNMRAAGQHGLTRGLPDLVAIAPGLPVGFIELKTFKGRLRPEQIVFKDICQSNGVRYALTRGLDEAFGVIEAWGLVHGEAKVA